MTYLIPELAKQDAADELIKVDTSYPYSAVVDPVTQHCKSDGPEQYPGTGVPLQIEVCIQVPEPDGVEHLLLVQPKKNHYIIKYTQ